MVAYVAPSAKLQKISPPCNLWGYLRCYNGKHTLYILFFYCKGYEDTHNHILYSPENIRVIGIRTHGCRRNVGRRL